MEATYEIHPYIDDKMGYAVLVVDGAFEHEHPVDGTDQDDHTIGPRVEARGVLTWYQDGREIEIESYGSGHLHSIDEGAALVLESITVSTDSGLEESYWADWTPEQIEWRDKHAESVDAMRMCEGTDDEGTDNPCGKRHPDGCYGSSLTHLRRE